jgi:polyisoprenoid-binding protein YceI
LNHEGSSINNIENVTFTCKATDIKSERTLMDIKAYNALKAKEYPDIKFFGLSTTRLILNGNKFTGDLIGKLSVAGETNDITVPFTGTFIDSTTINISASTNIALSSFNITPPTALRGALNTGDKISVSFNLEFIRKTL